MTSQTHPQEVAELVEHIREQIAHVEQRIADGKELGATVWRLALEDVARENRAILAALELQSPSPGGEEGVAAAMPGLPSREEIALALINESRRFNGRALVDRLADLPEHHYRDQLRYAIVILKLISSHSGETGEGTMPLAADALDAETVEAIERLRIMAKQRPTSEMDEEDLDRADWQGAYDWFCTESREILAALSSGKTVGAGEGEG